jgi:hypothetical protein
MVQTFSACIFHPEDSWFVGSLRSSATRMRIDPCSKGGFRSGKGGVMGSDHCPVSVVLGGR